MTTNSATVEQLEDAKDVLQKQCNKASGAQVLQLMTMIHQISDEIGAIEVKALDDAPYVPTTDPFKKDTDAGKAFLATLNSLKTAFGFAIDVASALDTVIHIFA